jgi:hypothetical protein
MTWDAHDLRKFARSSQIFLFRLPRPELSAGLDNSQNSLPQDSSVEKLP